MPLTRIQEASSYTPGHLLGISAPFISRYGILILKQKETASLQILDPS
jgi:hypothetical protein